jgi:hypothetical protein
MSVRWFGVQNHSCPGKGTSHSPGSQTFPSGSPLPEESRLGVVAQHGYEVTPSSLPTHRTVAAGPWKTLAFG